MLSGSFLLINTRYYSNNLQLIHLPVFIFGLQLILYHFTYQN